MGWVGVGWGGMLTFLVLRTYNIATLLRSLASFTTLQVATLLMGWVGVGWGGMLTFLVLRTYNIATLLRSLASASFTTLQVAVCHQRNQFTRKTAQKASTRPCLAGTQMIDRAWRSLKFEWLPAHINATQKKQYHTVLSPIVSELVFQWAWRQHQGPMSPNQFLKALQGLLKH